MYPLTPEQLAELRHHAVGKVWRAPAPCRGGARCYEADDLVSETLQTVQSSGAMNPARWEDLVAAKKLMGYLVNSQSNVWLSHLRWCARRRAEMYTATGDGSELAADEPSAEVRTTLRQQLERCFAEVDEDGAANAAFFKCCAHRMAEGDRAPYETCWKETRHPAATAQAARTTFFRLRRRLIERLAARPDAVG